MKSLLAWQGERRTKWLNHPLAKIGQNSVTRNDIVFDLAHKFQFCVHLRDENSYNRETRIHVFRRVRARLVDVADVRKKEACE